MVASIHNIETGLSIIAEKTLTRRVVEMGIRMGAGETAANSVDVPKDNRGTKGVK